MIFIDEMKDFKVYSKPFYLPMDEKNRRKGSSVFLLTPNLQSSIGILNSPLLINKGNVFNSYYMEKNISYYLMNESVFDIAESDTDYIHGVEEPFNPHEWNHISNKSKCETQEAEAYHKDIDGAIHEYVEHLKASCLLDKSVPDKKQDLFLFSPIGLDEYGDPLDPVLVGKIYLYFTEDFANYDWEWGYKTENAYLAEMSAAERNALSDSDFGVAELRKYPLDSAAHVKSAVKFFNHVDKKYESELAHAIIRKAKKFKVELNPGDDNRLKGYLESTFMEADAPIPVQSVTGLIQDDNGRFLLIYSTTIEKFNLPGGKIEPGETPEEALYRELKEEVNVTPVKYEPLYNTDGVANYIHRMSENQFHDTTYHITKFNGTVKNMEPEKCKGYKWLSIEDIMRLPADKKSEVLLQLERNVRDRKIPIYQDPRFAEIADKKIVFYGYKYDIQEIKKTINDKTMKEIYADLGFAKPDNVYLNVNVIDHFGMFKYPSQYSIWVYNKTFITNHYPVPSYEYYLKSELYAFVLGKLSANSKKELNENAARYLSGEMQAMKDKGMDTDEVKVLYGLYSYIEQTAGRKELINIILKGDVKKLSKYAVKGDMGNMVNKINIVLGETFILEGDDYAVNMDQLKRRIKRKGRVGSVYQMNKIKRFIDKATDPNEETPDIKDSQGNVINPSLNVPKVPTATGTTTDAPSATADSSSEEIKSTVPTESFYTYYTDSDYLLNEETLVMIKEEAVEENPILRKLLYKERIKKNKEVMDIYSQIKAAYPTVKFTYLTLDRYKGNNLFIDVSYYNDVFFRNNTYENKRGLDAYSKMMSNLLNGARFTEAGYMKKTVFIPVLDWDLNDATRMWIYREDLNPISIIYEGMVRNPQLVNDIFKDMDVVFFGSDRYFKANFSKYNKDQMKKMSFVFSKLVTTLRNNQSQFITPDEEDGTESKKAIVTNIADKLEKSQGIKIMSVGLTGEKEIKDIQVDPDKPEEEIQKEVITTSKKEELAQAIDKAASESRDTEEALEQLDNDRIKQLILDLSAEEQTGAKVNDARSSRLIKVQQDFVDKDLKGVKIQDLLAEKESDIPVTALKISSPNEEWKEVKFINYESNYNIDADIVKILNSMSTFLKPIVVRNLDIEDTSTSQDYIYTYTANLEDSNGARFTIKFDIPKFIDHNYMVLRGNKKQMNIQSFLMPIIKTEDGVCQIITNYNKIFIRRSSNIPGKTNAHVDRLIKALAKYEGEDIQLIPGDNSVVCRRFELPIDYIDLASVYNVIETKQYIIPLNQKKFREDYTVDDTKGLPLYVEKSSKTVFYFNDDLIKDVPELNTATAYLANLILTESNSFKETYDSTKAGIKHTFAQCSMMGNKIPLIVVCAYADGMINTLNKAGIEYELKEKLTPEDKKDPTREYIKFKDGYLLYNTSYQNDLLMNGMLECDTESHTLSELNDQAMYNEFLDNFGGRILGDGLDSFQSCLIDPITKECLEDYHLPTDYVEVLLQGGSLLVDNKFIPHMNYTSSRRFRREELIAAKLYRVLCSSYEAYYQQLKRSRQGAALTMKRSAVIDAIMNEPILSDKSFVNALSDVEDCYAISTKGHSGMNSDHAYSVDKRGFDPTMVNIMSMSTGFAGNVGITRQGTIDLNIDGERGYVHSGNKDEMSDAKSLSHTEAVTPFSSTHDDPIRTAMTFIQTSKHSVTTEKSDPALVTNGADEALAYYASNIFAFKAKNNGKVIEKNDSFMIVEYKDGTHDKVDIGDVIEKNSNGGYSITFEIITSLKVGSTFKKDDILAYEKSSFSDDVGEDNLTYNIGRLGKIAIINTGEGFEDSAGISEFFCKDLTTKVTIPRMVTIPKNTNIYNLIKKGTPVNEGDTLVIMQTPTTEEDVAMLLKNITGSEEEVSELGRIPIKSHYTGVVKDIKIYRTCEMDEGVSESLTKAVNAYEKEINTHKKMLKKYDLPDYELPSTAKLEPIGKFKNAEDSIIIEFFIEYEDVFGIGDKMVYYSGNKGINKYIIPLGLEPTSTFRPDEKMASFVSISSINGRMITSTILMASLNKLMIELWRSAMDILNIPYDVNDL